MVKKLSSGPVSLSQLAKPLAIGLAAAVQHLPVLGKSGMVCIRKDGADPGLVVSNPGVLLRHQIFDPK
jgi:predicted ArsR family transcriptional regulator